MSRGSGSTWARLPYPPFGCLTRGGFSPSDSGPGVFLAQNVGAGKPKVERKHGAVTQTLKSRTRKAGIRSACGLGGQRCKPQLFTSCCGRSPLDTEFLRLTPNSQANRDQLISLYI